MSENIASKFKEYLESFLEKGIIQAYKDILLYSAVEYSLFISAIIAAASEFIAKHSENPERQALI